MPRRNDLSASTHLSPLECPMEVIVDLHIDILTAPAHHALQKHMPIYRSVVWKFTALHPRSNCRNHRYICHIPQLCQFPQHVVDLTYIVHKESLETIDR